MCVVLWVVGWGTLCCSYQKDGPVIFGRMKFASLEAYLGGGFGHVILSHSFHTLSGRSPDMPEILLTGTLSLNSI